MANPPDVGELEISFFGPGYGECVILHIPGGTWIVVDSCENPISQKSCGLEYLQSIGVDIASQVKLVIASHWHDDHFRGLASIYREAKKAVFGFSAALQTKEFLTLTQFPQADYFIKGPSGISEFSEILQEWNGRRERGDNDHLSLLQENSEVFRDKWNDQEWFIRALSPSTISITRAIAEISQVSPSENSPRKPFVATIPNPNYVSVVLWIYFPPISILLGSDLENCGDEHCGWAAILHRVPGNFKKADVYKVPHRGSENAHCDEIWEKLLKNQPLAIVTPWKKGNKILPTPDGIKLILNKTSSSYVTATKRVSSPPKDSFLEQNYKHWGVKFTNRPFHPGHVRTRFKYEKAGTCPEIVCNQGASKLEDFY